MFQSQLLRAGRSSFAIQSAVSFSVVLLNAAICMAQLGPSHAQATWSSIKSGIPSDALAAPSSEGGQVQVVGLCAPLCPIDWVGDGICDETCHVAECNYDGGDCGSCAPGCPYEWVGDNYCDDVCDNASCNSVRNPALLIHQCDIDRSGFCLPADIIAEIDLLNGANLFPIQNGKSLPLCPYTLP